ncbi:hypothetical protein [Vibrio vulnificus YJ016]|uniref:Uncharacterized protein n=1 Tax=Vibrio vulnificus (strain YJ016) TaxID=196600 RepID=Q7MLY2_VIBVY|nr:hypothetical protein [Vibrio vulnificus YJ016]
MPMFGSGEGNVHHHGEDGVVSQAKDVIVDNEKAMLPIVHHSFALSEAR